ncbi:zinc-dependent alcohol dehydrogenase family protein [Lactococcus termiticola]|uniref:enoyl-[acyl-carrier-protein] reductase n=1 Tax=Lactococcus termiticola TaxID=2169526 RepID=A0A2R5HKB9_9LACT|nr:zinc-dependent alcohol dehydrogenase family protein [Lactococcus termiticola]GBG96961.1 NADPH:quinone reductase [Lactococcus termiticola]
MTYKSIGYESFGEPREVLEIRARERSPLKYAQLRVQMLLAPVNPSDLIPVTGAYRHRTPLPAIAGYEGVGLVLEVGPGLSSDLLGKRVLPLEGEGTWQEEVVCEADYAVMIPDELDDLSASQLYINPLTAYLLVNEVFQLQPGKKLAVTAGASAIGKCFAQLAKTMGFDYYAIVRNSSHDKELYELGAKAVLTDAKGLQFDAVVDCVGGEVGTSLAKQVKSGGHFQALGLLSGEQVDWAEISELPIKQGLFHLRYWLAKHSPEAFQEKMADIIGLVQKGELVINQDVRVLPFTDIKQALASDEKGKMILDFRN